MESLTENYYYNLNLDLLRNDLFDSLGNEQNYTKKLTQYYPSYSDYFLDDLVTVIKQPIKDLLDHQRLIQLEVSSFLDDNIKNNIIYLTINPSREFMYSQNKKLLSGVEQFSYMLNSLRKCGLQWCSISCEQGNQQQSRYTMYHYHIILYSPHKSNFKHKLNIKNLRSFFTNLHLASADHKQFSVVVSNSDYSRIKQGVYYFTGFNTTPNSLSRKADHLFTIKSF